MSAIYKMLALKCNTVLFESQILGSFYSSWNASFISKCQKWSLIVKVKQIENKINKILLFGKADHRAISHQ